MTAHKSLSLKNDDLYRHYKGGRYRILRRNVEMTSTFEKHYNESLYENVYHSDDCRPIIVLIDFYPFTIKAYDAALGIVGPDGRYPPVPSHSAIYISLDYGTIFCRRQAEFDERVMFEGIPVQRFTKVDRF